MSRGGRESAQANNLLHLGYRYLEECFKRGKNRSKHRDKRSKTGIAPYIYTHTTLRLYKRKWAFFCAYLTACGIKPRTLPQAAAFVPQYIDWLTHQPGRCGNTMSAWTIRTYFSAAAKVLQISARDYPLPLRHRADIFRSRRHRPDEAHRTQFRRDFFEFCCCTGLRKGKELRRLRGTDLEEESDGTYRIFVRNGKGGRQRHSLIIGRPEQVAAVVARMQAAGSDLVWPKMPSNADVHYCRNLYAHRAYDLVARDTSALPKSQLYYCRRDRKGIVLDRAAMLYASKQLGHNRLNVIAGHYLY